MSTYEFRAKVKFDVGLLKKGDWFYFTLKKIWDKKLLDFIDWSTLGQFINRYDEKKVKIYEGDVCKNGDWVEDAHAYCYREEDVIYDPQEGSYKGWNHNEDGMTCLVIGSIHIHPHLLAKGGDDGEEKNKNGKRY